jgi:hypothetical protein
MWFREYNGKDFTLKIKWKVNNGETSQTYEVNRTDGDRNMEDPWKVHYIDFKEFGVAPIQLEKDQNIEISVSNPGRNQFTYLHGGYLGNYCNISD